MVDPDTQNAVIKISAGLAGVLYALAQLPWAELAAAATFVFMAMQTFFLLRDKWWRDRKNRAARKKWARINAIRKNRESGNGSETQDHR